MRLLVSQSLIALCRSQLDYKQELNVDALVAITIDHKEVIVINVKDSLEFNPLSPSAHSCMRSPQLYSSRSPAYFSSPFQNESVSDLDESLHDKIFLTENQESIEETKENCQNLADIRKQLHTDPVQKDENSTNSNETLREELTSPQLTIIAPSNSVHEEDLQPPTVVSLEGPEDTPQSTNKKLTSSQNFDLSLVTKSSTDENTFPKISLKSFSPTHLKNKIRLHFKKSFGNPLSTDALTHGITFSNNTLNKKIILNSSLASSQLLSNTTFQQSLVATETNNILSTHNHIVTSNSDVSTTTSSASNLKALSLASSSSSTKPTQK